MISTVILASGKLGVDTLKKLYTLDSIQIACVFTDSHSDEIINYCEINSLPVLKGNPRKGIGAQFLSNFTIELLISINYLFLIESDIFLQATGLAFNLHGSLLPKYRGRTPHVWAIINGETEVGITAHKIDNGCDTGDIIEQIRIPVGIKDTGNDVLNKFQNLYFPLIQKVISNYSSNNLNFTKQDVKEATYFEKRTPDSGLIDWNKSGIEIYNWVRAQAYPYPGAFFFNNRKKIIVDEVAFLEVQDEELHTKENEVITLNSNDYVRCKDGLIHLVKVRNVTT